MTTVAPVKFAGIFSKCRRIRMSVLLPSKESVHQ
jgi:hypothetical protein